MTALFYGIQVMIVGLLIVFSGLTILIGCIKCMEKIMGRTSGKQDVRVQIQEKTPVNPKQAAQPEATVNDDAQLEAVITAAVAAMKGFVVRSIRRVSNASAWNRAGREEQIYSRL